MEKLDCLTTVAMALTVANKIIPKTEEQSLRFFNLDLMFYSKKGGL